MLANLEEYTVARSVRDVVNLLARDEGARVVAGGTVMARASSSRVTRLVDVSRVGLDYVAEDGKEVRIGSCLRFEAARSSPALRKVASGIICSAAGQFSSAIVRNMATLGGDVLSPYSWADMPPILLALDARLRFLGSRELVVPMTEFYAMRKELGLDRMLLVEMVVDRRAAERRGVFLKFGRTRSDIGIVTLAATASVEEGALRGLRMAVAGATVHAVRLPTVERVAAAKAPDRALLEAAAEAAIKDVSPAGDVRATAEYRAELLRAAVKRACVALAREEGSR